MLTLKTVTTGHVNGGGLGKHSYARCHYEDSREDDRQHRLIPFEKVIQAMSQNDKVVKELTMRIGFYQIRVETGSGNFSQAKLRIHALSRVRQHCVGHLRAECSSSVYIQTDLFVKKDAILNSFVS
uniref:Uncharacterized protein n=1 Tax=Calidris pygmaea TaxID=425635 RepID=A0A8C3PNU8_9CHAR